MRNVAGVTMTLVRKLSCNTKTIFKHNFYYNQQTKQTYINIYRAAH